MNLTVGELFLLKWADGKLTTADLPGYFFYDFVDINKESLDALVNRGYLSFADRTKNIKYLTIPELKTILSKKGLKKSGKKQEIVDFILHNFEEDELKVAMPSNRYRQTEKGKAELESNQIYFINKYRHYGFSNDELTQTKAKLKAQNKAFNDNDVLWVLFNEKQLRLALNSDWGMYSMCQLYMTDLLVSERRYRTALPHMCIVLFVELSGVYNGNLVTKIDKVDLDLIFERIDLLAEILSNCGMSVEQFSEYFLNDAKRYFPKLPFNYFTLENKCSIICDVLKGKSLSNVIKRYSHEEPSEDNKDYIYFKDEDDSKSEAVSRRSVPINQQSSANKSASGCFTIVLVYIIIFAILFWVIFAL